MHRNHDGVDTGCFLRASLEVLVLIIRVMDTDETRGLLRGLRVQGDASHGVVLRELVDNNVLPWGEIGMHVARLRWCRCIAVKMAIWSIPVNGGWRVRVRWMSSPGLTIRHGTDRAKVPVGRTVHAGLGAEIAILWGVHGDREVGRDWWAPVRLVVNNEGAIGGWQRWTKCIRAWVKAHGMWVRARETLRVIERGTRIEGELGRVAIWTMRMRSERRLRLEERRV